MTKPVQHGLRLTPGELQSIPRELSKTDLDVIYTVVIKEMQKETAYLHVRVSSLVVLLNWRTSRNSAGSISFNAVRRLSIEYRLTFATDGSLRSLYASLVELAGSYLSAKSASSAVTSNILRL